MGKEAMELFREVSPDLVLLDITMPGRSGLEVLEEMLEPGPQYQGHYVLCRWAGDDDSESPDHRGSLILS
ncbi:MAG: response regulator transcription factor [Acutalibacteraceae bacterium]